MTPTELSILMKAKLAREILNAPDNGGYKKDYYRE